MPFPPPKALPIMPVRVTAAFARRDSLKAPMRAAARKSNGMSGFGDDPERQLLSKGGCYRPFVHLPTFDNSAPASWSLRNPDVTPESRSLEHFTTSSGLLNISIKPTLSRTAKCRLMNCMSGSGIQCQPQEIVTWSSFAFEMYQDVSTTIPVDRARRLLTLHHRLEAVQHDARLGRHRYAGLGVGSIRARPGPCPSPAAPAVG